MNQQCPIELGLRALFSLSVGRCDVRSVRNHRIASRRERDCTRARRSIVSERHDVCVVLATFRGEESSNISTGQHFKTAHYDPAELRPVADIRNVPLSVVSFVHDHDRISDLVPRICVSVGFRDLCEGIAAARDCAQLSRLEAGSNVTSNHPAQARIRSSLGFRASRVLSTNRRSNGCSRRIAA